jgi:hypothetical protein
MGACSVSWTRRLSIANELSNQNVTATLQMTAKNVDVTRIKPLHKICCNIQKTDHMMGT